MEVFDWSIVTRGRIQKMSLRIMVAFMVVSGVNLTPEQEFKPQIIEQQQGENKKFRRLATLTELVAGNLLENDEIQNFENNTLGCSLHQKTGNVSCNITELVFHDLDFTPLTGAVSLRPVFAIEQFR